MDRRINDEHGHDVGDAMLKDVAERLRRCVRESASVCRLGGDEFTIIEDAILPQAVNRNRCCWDLIRI